MPRSRRVFSKGKAWTSAYVWLIVSSLAVLAIPLRGAEGATVTFSLSFPNSDPESYTISVNSDGRAHYECSAKVSDESDQRESYQTDFILSDATRARIFELASQAHYFSEKVDTSKHKVAFTGAKKLVYTDGTRNNTAEYNYSTVPAVEQLTSLFQGLAATLEFGRHLVYLHRYQKLGLDDELTHMEDSARRGEVTDLEAVKPILQQIYDDSSVMNMVRARAQRILDMGDLSPTSQRR
jgi:hypothetical protein